MQLGRINQLRGALDEEAIDLMELSEIEEAFREIPDEDLRDLRENAMAADMLDELEERVSPLEKFMWEYICENYGESEANDPCYNLQELANAINDEFPNIK